MKYALLLIGLSWVCRAAQAQGNSEGVYAAPGMSVKLSRQVLPPVPARRSAVASKLQTKASVVSPILPRFWHQTDTARSNAAQRVNQFTTSQIKYPGNTLRAGIDGKIYAKLTLSADGTVNKAIITRRELDEKGGDIAYSEKGKAALDAEVLRVLQTLRFQPSNATGDTITIMQRFVMQ